MFFAAIPAFAHQPGEAYIMLDIGTSNIAGRIEVTLPELNDLLDLDQNGDGKVSDEEFLDRQEDAISYVFERFALGSEDRWFDLAKGGVTFENYPLGRYAFFHFTLQEPEKTPEILRIRYSLLFETDPRHRGLLLVEKNALTGLENNHETISLIFGPDSEVQTINLLETSSLPMVLTFIKHGAWHIWIGIDHIFFLAVLLFQSVLLQSGGVWKSVGGFKPALWNAAKIVTLFTIAHSITLSLAALGVVNLSSRLVESIIAASIVCAALFNFFPTMSKRLPLIIFLFGLFHGFGFASVLGHLTSRAGSLVPALLGFNVGVELGQIAFVCLSFPILYAVRGTRFYEPIILKMGSGAIAVLACVWFVERAFAVGPFINW